MRKITPFLWFESGAQEAVALYTSLFEEPKALRQGEDFIAMDGGQTPFTPAISFFAQCASPAEVDRAWEKLSPGGTVLMPLDRYPWSERYGWIQDRFGVTWQILVSPRTERLAPCLMYVGKQHGKAEEAMQFYSSQFDDSGVEAVARYEEGEGDTPGMVKHAAFRLAGQPFIALDSGLPHPFTFSQATSLLVRCDSQEEIDRLWERFTAEGEEGQCGWLKDRYGVSWQIVPPVLGRLLQDPDRERAKRVLDAMLQMKKIDIAKIEAAAAGE